MDQKEAETGPYARTERRIARWTLLLGFAAAVGAALWFSLRSGAGVLVGAVLAWVSFRWLKGALDALARVSTAQAEAIQVRLPVWSLVRIFLRYALLGLAVYVIFVSFKVPVLSMLVGLCALGAATLAASIYELLWPTG